MSSNTENSTKISLPQPSVNKEEESTSGLRSVSTQESHQVQLTEYHDAADTLETSAPSATPQSLWEGTNPLPDQNLRDVLSRSYQIGVYTWTTAGHGTDLISNLDVIAKLMTNPNIGDKVKYFKYFRAKGVNLTVRVNSTPWHYGTLVLSSTVNNSYNFHNSANPNAFQYLNNRPVLVDAASMDAVDYEIHWKSQAQWYDVKTATPANIMTFRMTVGIALSMIGTTMTDAKVTVFANFIDPEVAFPVADSITSAQVQSGRKKASKEARQKSESNSVVSDIKSFADTTFEIVGQITDVAEKLAPLASFMADKPSTLRPTDHVVVLPGTDMPGFHGLDTGVKLCGDPEATAGFDPGVIGEAIGNPSIYSLVRIPGFTQRWSFTSSTAVGTRLTQLYLSVSGHSELASDVYTPSPLTWYTSLFRYWRGGLKLFFHFATSSFITARLRFVWIPPGHAAPGTIADNESGDYVSQVIEVTGSMNHEVTIPWINDVLYKQTAEDNNSSLKQRLSVSSIDESASLGTLAVYLVTPIVSVDSTLPPKISCLSWISAAEDFQLSNFAGELTNNGDDWDWGWTAESAQIQCSIYERFETPFEPIIESRFSFEAGIATCESYTDIVTLCKRYSIHPLRPETASGVDYSVSHPWDAGIMANTGDMDNFQKWLTACFVNFRGSVRYKDFWHETFDTGGELIIRGATSTRRVGYSRVFSSQPTFVSQNKSNNFAEYELPWNTYLPFLYRGQNGNDYGLNPEVQLPVTDASTLTIVGHRAFAMGDDFAVGVYQAPPLVKITTPPPLVQDESQRTLDSFVHINDHA